MHHKVSIYYDETHLEDYSVSGHVLFFVPDQIEVNNNFPLFKMEDYVYSPRTDLLKQIFRIRGNKFLNRKFHFKNLRGTEFTEYDFCVEEMSSALIQSLSTKKSFLFPLAPYCKVAILYYPFDKDPSLYGGEKRAERVLRYNETTLRFLLKGALHSLYDHENQVTVSNFIVDGMSSYREFNDYRITWRLLEESSYSRSPLRDYVHLDPLLKISHIDSDHKSHSPGTRSYEDANLLQCADLLLGSSNYSLFPPKKDGTGWKKHVISRNFYYLIWKSERGGGMKNSRHYKSFNISQVVFRDGETRFKNIQDMLAKNTNTGQLFLFGLQ